MCIKCSTTVKRPPPLSLSHTRTHTQHTSLQNCYIQKAFVPFKISSLLLLIIIPHTYTYTDTHKQTQRAVRIVLQSKIQRLINTIVIIIYLLCHKHTRTHARTYTHTHRSHKCTEKQQKSQPLCRIKSKAEIRESIQYTKDIYNQISYSIICVLHQLPYLFRSACNQLSQSTETAKYVTQ